MSMLDSPMGLLGRTLTAADGRRRSVAAWVNLVEVAFCSAAALEAWLAYRGKERI